MNLLRYIKGFKCGKGAHRIELEAMKDPFLSEALEGYDAIDGNHLERIARLQKQIGSRRGKKINVPWKKWGIVVILLLCLLLVSYLFIMPKSYENTESESIKIESEKIEIVKDTLKLQQDTLIQIDTLPESPSPLKKPVISAKTLQDSLKEHGREIEILKLNTPRTQLQIPVAPQPENKPEAVETAKIEVLF